MPEQPNNKNSSNQKLMVGIIAGILLGVLIAFYALDYLPLAANTVLTVVITLFAVFIFLFLALTWYRDKLVKRVFGKDIEFDSLIQETQEVVHTITENAADTLLKPLPEPEREKAKVLAPRIVNYLLWARFRNWGLRTLVAFFVAVGGLVGTILLFNQNKLLEKQNEKIDYQINLEESTRRSSLVFLMANIMDKIDEELKDTLNTNSNTRRLSPQLIGRIAALSQSLKPYRYLDTGADSLTTPLSPERAQLFLSLLNSELDSVTNNEIFSKATFVDADLRSANLHDANLLNANLSYADLYDADLSEANLRHAILYNANLSYADLYDADLYDANLTGANLCRAYLYRADLYRADLSGANLRHAVLYHSSLIDADLPVADLRRANLIDANLLNANLFYADLSDADLTGANLTGANLYRANLTGVENMTIDQLSEVKSLYECKGLPEEIEKELRKKRPELFVD